jgi:hypothetical protein
MHCVAGVTVFISAVFMHIHTSTHALSTHTCIYIMSLCTKNLINAYKHKYANELPTMSIHIVCIVHVHASSLIARIQ